MEEEPDFLKQIKEELEFRDLTVKDAEDIVELVENLKQKISEIVLEDSLAEKLTGTIENVLKNNKTFEICFTIHGEKQNKTISYKEEEYEKYQDIFSDNRKFRYYIMAFEWLIRRNL